MNVSKGEGGERLKEGRGSSLGRGGRKFKWVNIPDDEMENLNIGFPLNVIILIGLINPVEKINGEIKMIFKSGP